MKSIALVGNPNSGKSTLFNALTGATQFVGNWPGVTVEKKGGKTKINGEAVEVMDTPGIYSLSPYSNEEIITRDYILQEKPQVVINIVDASNLERNLYLTTQIIELGVPVVVALNMIDVVKNKGEKISAAALQKELGCPVCEISAINKTGIDEMKKVVGDMLTKGAEAPKHSFRYAADVEAAISDVAAQLEADHAQLNMGTTNFVALKVLCNDSNILENNKIPASVNAKADEVRKAVEDKYDDDFDSIVSEQRYTWIKSIIGRVIVERRKETLSLSDKIDKVLTNRILALPIFFAIIYGIYFVCLNPAGLGKKLVGICFNYVISFMIWLTLQLMNLGVASWLIDMIVNGCVFGLGIVVAFIPYLMILFVFLAILEECGYMARVTFIFDRLFRRFGLSGKSFVPMLLGTGCTVQAVASTRTIENENDRKMTIFLTPFMPCATKMPTIMLMVSLFAGSNAWVAPLVYVLAIIFIILGGILLKNTAFKGEPAPFVMELPEYKLPRLTNIWHFVWDRTVALFRKLTSIIFVSTLVIWFLKSFTFSLKYVPNAALDFTPIKGNIEQSMLATIARFLEPIFAPLGFGSWQMIAAMLTGYVAKDNVLATLGLILGAADVASVSTILTPAGAVGFLLFFMLSSACFSAMGAMRKELGSAKLTLGAIGFQFGSAYVVSLVAYQVLRFVM